MLNVKQKQQKELSAEGGFLTFAMHHHKEKQSIQLRYYDQKELSAHGGFLTFAMHHHRETINPIKIL